MTSTQPATTVRSRGATWSRSLSGLALVPLVVVLAACGGGSGPGGSGAAAAPSSSPTRTGGQNGQGGQGGRTFPGASGLIAAVSAGTLQVQSNDAQTTVTYTAATRFTKTEKGTVTAGQCVMVTGAPLTGSPDALTATSVRIEAKVDGTCPTAAGRGPGGFGGGAGQGGGQGGFGGGQAGTGAPRPSGAPSGGFRSFAFATGSVTAVSGDTVTVQGVLRAGRPSSSSSASASPTPTAITVKLDASTTVTQSVAATSASAVVGQCATALGKADDRGDIAATSITVSAPDPATGCRAGFGGFGFGGAGGGGAGAGGGQGA